jgi:EF hand
MAISGVGSSFSNLNLTANVQERAQKLLQQLDSDADGKVSKPELAAMGEKMKANGPRRAEMGDAAAAKGAKAPAPPSADEMFAKADKDGDGSLSVEDLSAMMAEHEAHAAARGGPGAGGPSPGGPPPGGAPPGGAPPGGGGAPPGGAASSKSQASEEADPADTNGDGNVSAAEKLIYELSHPNVSDSKEA